jgi:hypothetical protein
MAKRTLPILSDPQAKKILKGLCAQHDVSLDLFSQMVEIQRENLGRGKQIGITQDFSAAIAEFLDSARGES